jgi:hypothetical protein
MIMLVFQEIKDNLRNHSWVFPECSEQKQDTTHGAPALHKDEGTLTRESSNIKFKTKNLMIAAL